MAVDWSFTDFLAGSRLSPRWAPYASVQLSDGTPVHLVLSIYNDSETGSGSFQWFLLAGSALRGSATEIWSGTANGMFAGLLALSSPGVNLIDLAVDGSDNLYVVMAPWVYTPAGQGQPEVTIQPFVKGVGHAWTPGTVFTQSIGQPRTTVSSGFGVTIGSVTVASTASLAQSGYFMTIGSGNTPVLLSYSISSSTVLTTAVVAGFTSGVNYVNGNAIVSTVMGVRATWVNQTGGGGGGYLLITWTGGGGTTGVATVDAAALLGGTFTLAASTVNPTFLAPFTYASATMNALDLSRDGFGAPSGLAAVSQGATYTFRSAAATNSFSATSVSVTKPAGTANTDALLAFFQLNDNTHTVVPPTGWTSAGVVVNSGVTYQVLWLQAGAAEPTSYSFTFSSGASVAGSVIMAAYNSHGAGVSSVALSNAVTAAGTLAMPGAANAAAGTLIYAIFGVSVHPTGLPVGTDQVDNQASASTYQIEVMDMQVGAAAYSGGRSINFSGSNSIGILSVALAPVHRVVTVGSWSIAAGGALSTNSAVGSTTGIAGTVSLNRVSAGNWLLSYLNTSDVVQTDYATAASYFTGASMPSGIAGLTTPRSAAPGGAVFADPVTPNQAWLVFVDGSTFALRRIRVTVNTTTHAVAWDNAAGTFDATFVQSAATNVRVTKEPRAGIADLICQVYQYGGSTNNTNYVLGAHDTMAPTPAAPTLGPPAYNAIEDLAAGQVLAWVPDPANGNGGYAFVRQATGGTIEWWDVGTATFVAGEDWRVQSSVTSINFPAGVWADNDTAYTWYVYTLSSYLIPSLQPFPWKVTGAAAPTVTPSVLGLATATPTVSWTFTPGTPTGVQASYRVVVGPSGWNPNSTTPTWDSGTVAGTATGPITTGGSLPTGLAEAAWDWYVYVTESNGATSGFVKVSGTISYTNPATPTLAASYSSATNAVTLTATGVANGNEVLFQYSLDGGTTWSTVRNGGTVTVSSSQAQVVDYDVCASGSSIKYRAWQMATGPVWSTAASAVRTVAVSWTGPWWIKDPANPAANFTFPIEGPFDDKIPEISGVFAPLGNPDKVVVSDGTKGVEGELKVLTIGTSDWAALQALISPSRTLLIQSPFGDSFYVWIQGDRGTLLSPSAATGPYRVTDLPFVSVARP